jgi:hypothetical protein
MTFVLFVGFVVLFCYGCERQYRIRQSQRQIAQLAELLLLRRAPEISTSASRIACDCKGDSNWRQGKRDGPGTSLTFSV